MHKAPANAEALDHLKRWGALVTDRHDAILCLSSERNVPVLQGPVKTSWLSPPPADVFARAPEKRDPRDIPSAGSGMAHPARLPATSAP